MQALGFHLMYPTLPLCVASREGRDFKMFLNFLHASYSTPAGRYGSVCEAKGSVLSSTVTPQKV